MYRAESERLAPVRQTVKLRGSANFLGETTMELLASASVSHKIRNILGRRKRGVIGLNMAKKKSKKLGKLRAHEQPNETQAAVRSDWDSVEVEFFAREAELYRTGPVETFDDLEND